MEVLLVRKRAGAIVATLEANEARYCISPLSIHICYYFCVREGVASERLQEFFEGFEILLIDQYVTKLAQKRYRDRDFEDCLQAACAEIGDCDEILTLDKTFAKHSGTTLPVTVV